MKINVTIDLGGLEKLNEIVLMKFKIGLRNMAEAIYKDIKQGTPIGASHQLQEGIILYPRSVLAMTYYVTSGPTKYALPAFMGSKPHFPPVEPLIPWVKLRNFASELGNNLFRRAFVLAVVISKRGTIGIEKKTGLWKNSVKKHTEKVGDYIKI